MSHTWAFRMNPRQRQLLPLLLNGRPQIILDMFCRLGVLDKYCCHYRNLHVQNFVESNGFLNPCPSPQPILVPAEHRAKTCRPVRDDTSPSGCLIFKPKPSSLRNNVIHWLSSNRIMKLADLAVCLSTPVAMATQASLLEGRCVYNTYKCS